MPRRNVLKIDAPYSYYHVFARGASKQRIFLDNQDFLFFLSLFQRYLSPAIARNSAGVRYQKLHNDLQLQAYCLMGNHFHLLLYQQTEGSMQRLMRGVMTAYSRYHNAKYDRSGQLFESRYKAARLPDQSYAPRVSRYIHRNPISWFAYPYSSLTYYLDSPSPDWLQPGPVLARFATPLEYEAYLADSRAAEDDRQELKLLLADDGYEADL
ncbi:MAG TPA: transposase [Candidatus Saccharimonadales bacterium]|nr:transposase [Candidatus Saccharimonadales bacterium]